MEGNYLPQVPEMSFLFPDLSSSYNEKMSQLFQTNEQSVLLFLTLDDP